MVSKNLKVVNQQGETIGTVVGDLEDAVLADPAAAATKVVTAIATVRHFATDNKLGINTRSLEKLVAYGAAAVGATNGFTTLAMPPWLRAGLIFASGLVIAADKING